MIWIFGVEYYRKWNLLIVIVIILIIGISIGHYATPILHHHWHEIFRRLYYIPIILTALKYGLQGGFISSIAVCLIYLPHVVFQWSGSFSSNLIRFNEIILFLLIGNLAGLLADRTRQEKEKYRKTAEELDLAYNNLQQQSDQLTELEIQLRSADRLAVLGELTASLAHEVRNPLGSIKGAANILKKRCKYDDVSREFTQVLTDEASRLNRVVDNYLSMAKPISSMESTTDVIVAFTTVFQLTRPQIRKQNVQIQTDWPDGSVFIPMSDVEARQVFLNLMLNALAVLETSGKIKIQVLVSNMKVVIFFSDNGPGIPKKRLNEIFKPFYTTKKTGTGLGLAIVKRLVTSRHGTIEVESKPNNGTTFTISFPERTVE